MLSRCWGKCGVVQMFWKKTENCVPRILKTTLRLALEFYFEKTLLGNINKYL